jgi:anti-sigma factor ChrR (cupin superfamily)
MHLDSAQIEQYASGHVHDADAAAYAAHVSLCLHCADRIARRSRPAAGWQRRGALLRLVRAA